MKHGAIALEKLINRVEKAYPDNDNRLPSGHYKEHVLHAHQKMMAIMKIEEK